MNEQEQPEADFYETLEIDETATEAEIKRAYRRLARQHHPDVSPHHQTAALFRQIQEAYETLRDREARAAYAAKMSALQATVPFVLEVTLSQHLLPCWQEPQMLYLLGQVKAREDVPPPSPCNLNICILIDKSNSMAGERMEHATAAALSILAQLSPQDTISVVAFSDRAEIIAPPQNGGEGTTLAPRVRNIEPGGGTEIGEGLSTALALLAKAWFPGASSHLFLITDGHTYGDEARCLRLAEEAHRQGVAISTLGIGTGWNEEFLDRIAFLSGGLPFYAEWPSQIGEMLTQERRRLAALVCPQLEARCWLEPDVTLGGAFLIAPQTVRLAAEGASGPLRLGGLSLHSPISFLLELLVSPRPAGPQRLGTIQVKAAKQTRGIATPSVGLRQPVRVTFRELPFSLPPVPPEVVQAAHRATLLKLEEQARQDMERGWHEDASRRLRSLATRMLDVGEAELARTVFLEADRVAATGRMSPEGQKRVHYGTRMLRALPPGG